MGVAAIALGSNLGERRETLRSAVHALSGFGHVAAVSSLYETEPIGGPDQGPYLNAVLVLETELDPHRLLADLHAIEAAHGRERRTRWEARTLDLDLILYDDVVIEGEGVTVPHPRASERRFVLEPLVEVMPDAAFPDGTKAADALAQVLDQGLERHGHDNWWRHGFASRGGWWVVGQVVGIGAWVVAAILDRARFAGPASATIGVVLFLAGATLAWIALRSLGRNLTPYPEPMRSSGLVQTGIYARARHPIYGSVLLLVAGASLLAGSALALVFTAGLAAFFWRKAASEEERLMARYPDYPAYRSEVRWRLIPWVL